MDGRVETGHAALEAIMRLFWRQGPEATSYAQIVAATGLSRKALYARWPDKQALVHQTLRHYRDHVLTAQLASLRPPGAKALGRFWSALDEATQQDWPGCYLIRSAEGELRDDPVVRGLYRDYLADLNQSFVEAILAACRDLPRSRVLDAGAAAWQAVALVTLASGMAGSIGYDHRLAEALRAGRVACGLPPA